MKLRIVRTMSEDLKEEMKKLKEQITNLQDQLKGVIDTERKKRGGVYIDIGNAVQGYVEDEIQAVAEGVHGELEKSVFIGPRGVRIFRRRARDREEDEHKVSLADVAKVMNALGHEHRLKILDGLMSGGKYINELQEQLSEITTSTLSSHLNVLEEAGLVVQEKVRGRYLITMPGRTAYRMATKAGERVRQDDEECHTPCCGSDESDAEQV